MTLDAWIEQQLAERLPAFLQSQRWFGSKARPIREARCEDSLPLAGADTPLSVVLIRVVYEDDACDRYAMLIAAIPDGGELPIIGPVNASLVAVEATTDQAAMTTLLRTLGAVAEHPTRCGGRVVRHDTAEDTASCLATAADATPLGAEQSNTSIRVAHRYVFKLIRKHEDGENLELEIGRFLARRSFHGTPRLRGAWTWLGADGRASTLGVVQDWVENQGDGWRHVLQWLEATHGASSTGLLSDLRGLGKTTAALHVALGSDPADPAFRPEPLTRARVQAWQQALSAAIDRVRVLLASLSGANDDTRALARTVLDHAERLRAWSPPFGEAAASGTFDTIRIHGDYHLGQTLKTGDGFVVIDFEGEPARPLSERRRQQAAMRDVAGMLRSFDYAVETVRLDRSASAADDPLPEMRAAFLDAYINDAMAARASFVPRDRSTFDSWVSFFELEKVVYEIEYELNHRPEWARIPLRGALRLLGVASE